MWADYDSEADTLQITLAPIDRLDGDEVSEDGGLIVGFAKGRPALIDVLGAADRVAPALQRAATLYGLDREELLAIGRAALAAPDRRVELRLSSVDHPLKPPRFWTIGLLKVTVAAVVIAVALGGVARGFGLGDESPLWLLIFVVAMVLGSLFDKEGFWGDPHPFRREPRRG